KLPGLETKITGVEHERTHGCSIARFISEGVAMQSRFVVRGIVWAALYTSFILGPLFALLAGSHPPARDFWTEFSAAIGYAGLAMMGLQFGLTARLRYVTEPWGEDVIYHFHRQMSLIAVGLVVAHPIILFVIQPERLVLLNSFTAPWRARFAALSTYSLIALVVMALWRGGGEKTSKGWCPTPHRLSRPPGPGGGGAPT